MIVSVIVAVSENGVIGLEGGMPWRLKDDLKQFKALTMGHVLIVGRRTYESIGKALPGRRMVVVTRRADYEAPGCEVVHSLAEGLDLAREAGEVEVFIGGGAEIYSLALPLVDRIYLTRVKAEVEGDTFFPAFDEGAWVVVESQVYEAGEGNEFGFVVEVLERERIS